MRKKAIRAITLSTYGSRPVLGKNLHANKGWISSFISKSCAYPEKTAAWLDYMTSDEGMRLWGYGYEGAQRLEGAGAGER